MVTMLRISSISVWEVRIALRHNATSGGKQNPAGVQSLLRQSKSSQEKTNKKGNVTPIKKIHVAKKLSIIHFMYL
jgi:hypothetical protein